MAKLTPETVKKELQALIADLERRVEAMEGPARPQQVLAPGRIVLYRLSASDVQQITLLHDPPHQGNPHEVGQVVPAIVVLPWSQESFNGQAILDGTARLWLTSVRAGDAPGTWHWPEMKTPEPPTFDTHEAESAAAADSAGEEEHAPPTHEQPRNG